MMSMVTVAFVMCVIVSTNSAAEYFDPSPVYYDTAYVSEGNYQGACDYDTKGLDTSKSYVLVATEMFNIVEAWASWGYDPFFFTPSYQTEDQLTSCRKDDQDVGVYLISLYLDNPPYLTYDDDDDFLKSVTVAVDY
ncbi:MAG TPA: hypothetical protein DCM87_11940 [Planctomycetes bacterium]|nr:hypothetical protein [Planctomycetota bacterium]